MYSTSSLGETNQINKNEQNLMDHQSVFTTSTRDHRYCQAHELEMTRTETNSQITYKCPHCSRAYIELKDTAATCHKRRR